MEIFRDVSLHNAKEGYLRVKKCKKILAEVDRLAQVDPVLLPEGSSYLLEIDFTSIKQDTLERQSYWVAGYEGCGQGWPTHSRPFPPCHGSAVTGGSICRIYPAGQWW